MDGGEKYGWDGVGVGDGDTGDGRVDGDVNVATACSTARGTDFGRLGGARRTFGIERRRK